MNICENRSNNFQALWLLAATALFLTGCNTAHTTLHAPTPVSTIDSIKTAGAQVSARVQVVNFAVNVINSGSENVTKEQLRRNLEVFLGNRIFSSLGARRAFTEVTRAESANPQSADYIVSGAYDFDFTSNRFFGAHMHYKGVINVVVTDVKSAAVVFQKSYTEEESDSSNNGNTARIQWLQNAVISEISADIRNAIFKKLGK